MDATVYKYAAGELGIGDEEAGGVELVAGLGAYDAGGADCAGGGFGVGVAVGRVEAAGEAAHYFEVGVKGGGVDDGLGLQDHSSAAKFDFLETVVGGNVGKSLQSQHS